MGDHLRVQLDFRIKSPNTVRGLERVTDFVAAGLQKVLTEDSFPVDIERGARMRVTDVEPRKRAAKKKVTKKATKKVAKKRS